MFVLEIISMDGIVLSLNEGFKHGSYSKAGVKKMDRLPLRRRPTSCAILMRHGLDAPLSPGTFSP